MPQITTQIANKYGSCARNRNIWITEGTKFWYINTNENGMLLSNNWNLGPELHYPVYDFQFGRVFIRHQNEKWGLTSCAMLCIYGGKLLSNNQPTDKMQALVTKGKIPNVNYMIISDKNYKETLFPPNIFKLPEPIYGGIGLTSQWPEMLVTGDRCIAMGFNKKGNAKIFMIELRFGDSIFGDKYEWKTLEIGNKHLESIKSIIAGVSLNQHYHSLHFRKSNFLIVTSRNSFNLQLGPIQSYLPVESSLPKEISINKKLEYESIYKDLATFDYYRWENLFKSGQADKFIDMNKTPFINNIGVPFTIESNEQKAEAYTLLYRMSWLGKIFVKNWDNSDQILVSNKFTKFGNKFFHPLCEDNAGLDINGRVEKESISLLDGKYCWKLTYGCEAGRKILPTIPPIPTALIRDELRYVTFKNKIILVGNTYLMIPNSPKLVLFFALIPTTKINLI